MKYRFLAFDLDDTIVPSGTNDLSKKVKRALQEVSKQIHVSIVTARAKTNFERMLDLLEIEPAYHVYENGAKIVDPHGNILRDLHIPHSEVQTILNAAGPYFDEVGFCVDDHWNDSGAADTTHGVTGLSFTVPGAKNAYLIEKTIKSLSKSYSIYVGRHWDKADWYGVLLFHGDAQKGKGMHFIQQKLGISPEETIAIGDGATDISMFEYATVKVAIGNAEDQVKAKANYIAPSVNDFGIIDVINKYIKSS